MPLEMVSHCFSQRGNYTKRRKRNQNFKMQQEQSQKIEEKIQSMTSEEVKPFSTQTKEPFTEYVSYDLSNANNFNYQQNILFQQEQWYQRGQHGMHISVETQSF